MTVNVNATNVSAAAGGLSKPPLTIPGWAKLAAVAIALATVVIVLYQLRKTEFRLRVSEHQHIQQISATIIIVVSVMLVCRTSGLGFGPSLAIAGVGGGLSVPAIRHGVSWAEVLEDVPPRVRILAGWIGVFVLVMLLPSLGGGRGGSYAMDASSMVVFAMFADSAALIRELGERMQPGDVQFYDSVNT